MSISVTPTASRTGSRQEAGARLLSPSEPGWPRVVRYALAAAPLKYMSALAAMYLLKFASDVLLLDPAVFAAVFALSKLVDAVSDPAVGYASDRTRLALGRRRPWIIGAAIPMCTCFWAVWSPPALAETRFLTAWVCGALLAYYLAHTAAAVPHLALGAELTTDHHGRTRVFAARAVSESIGMGAAAGSMVWLQTSDDPRAAASGIAALFSLATLVMLIPTTLSMHERPDLQSRALSPPVGALRHVADNPHARILLGVVVLEALSLSLIAAVFPFIAAYALPENTAASAWLIVATIAVAIASFPLWPALARRQGKKNAWLLALLIRMLGFATMIFAWDRPWLQPVTIICIATSLSCMFILPPSVQSDAIDYDELSSGERKEGSYFACWNLAEKLAAAGAVVLGGGALHVAGFEPNVEQTAAAQSTMRWLFTGVPLLLHLLAFWLLRQLRMDSREHAAIRFELERRARAGERRSSAHERMGTP